VGTAFFPEDGFDAERLLAEADRRMYSMKHIHHAAAAAAQQETPQPQDKDKDKDKANSAKVP
jgi:GGDEF domain-containing protein